MLDLWPLFFGKIHQSWSYNSSNSRRHGYRFRALQYRDVFLDLAKDRGKILQSIVSKIIVYQWSTFVQIFIPIANHGKYGHCGGKRTCWKWTVIGRAFRKAASALRGSTVVFQFQCEWSNTLFLPVNDTRRALQEHGWMWVSRRFPHKNQRS
jgi:hypothetical protein